MNIEVDAETIVKACTGKGLNEVPQHSLLNFCQQAPLNHFNRPFLWTDEQLLPTPPTINLNVDNEAFSPWMRDFCLEHPITVINNLAQILNFDLSLFATKTIAKMNPNEIIEVRTQMLQRSDENWDQGHKQKVWDCYSHRVYSTIENYALYQNKEYRKSIKNETNTQNNENDHSNSNSEEDEIKRKNTKIRLGTNVDLSSIKKWKPQLEEIKKLPPLFQVDSDDNMLNHVGYNILGMNTVQLYMKVY